MKNEEQENINPLDNGLMIEPEPDYKKLYFELLEKQKQPEEKVIISKGTTSQKEDIDELETLEQELQNIMTQVIPIEEDIINDDDINDIVNFVASSTSKKSKKSKK